MLDHQGKTGVKLKAKKCQLLREETPFLGHIVSGGEIGVDPAKCKQVSEWPIPWELRDVCPLVGLSSYYHTSGHVTSLREATLCRACRSVRSLLREHHASLNDSQAVRLCGCLEELAHSAGCRQRNGVSFQADPRILVARVHKLVHFAGRDQVAVLRAIL